jgi:anti-sigma regulatory factor (Ser/Thr protein kinase)
MRYHSPVLGGKSLRVKADPAELQKAIDALEVYWVAAGVPRSIGWRLQLAVDEIVSNITRHTGARGAQVEVRAEVQDDAVSLTIEDDGPAFDPLASPGAVPDVPLDERSPGGVGVILVTRLVDDARYRRENDRNILVLTCRLSGTSPTAF